MDQDRIGISTAAFYPRRLTEDALVRIAELGFRVVEVFLQADAEYTSGFGAVLDQRRRRLGLDVHSLHLYATYFDLWSRYPRMVDEMRDRFHRVLEVATMVGAKALTWHGLRYGLSDPRLVSSFFESAAWAGEVAREGGVTLCIENVSWCYLRGPEHVEAIREAGLPVGFTFDAFQAGESQIEPMALVHAMGDRLTTAHLSDYRAEGPRHLAPGDGDLDWETLLGALHAVGYDGPLILETARVSTAEALLASRRFIRRTWERVCEGGD